MTLILWSLADLLLHLLIGSLDILDGVDTPLLKPKLLLPLSIRDLGITIPALVRLAMAHEIRHYHTSLL